MLVDLGCVESDPWPPNSSRKQPHSQPETLGGLLILDRAKGLGCGVHLLGLIVQVLVITFFGALVIFRIMGRNYDVAVISAGFTGLGLGATPIAIASMNAITRKHGPSFRAFLVVPLVGAFFVDIINAMIIKFFLGLSFVQ